MNGGNGKVIAVKQPKICEVIVIMNGFTIMGQLHFHCVVQGGNETS